MKKLTVMTLLMFLSFPFGLTAKAASVKGKGIDTGTTRSLGFHLKGEHEPRWAEENFENLFFEEEPLSSLTRTNAFHWERWMLGELEELNWQNPENRPPGLNFNGWSGIGSPVASAVPVPGAAWLLGAGMIGLIGFRSKTKK